MNSRKLILYISSSLDGFIAGPNDDLSFLHPMQLEGEDYGYEAFVDTVDTVIVGRRTYDWVVNQGYDFPHTDKEGYILTSQPRPNQGSLTFYQGDLKELVQRLKSNNSQKHIFCDGGAEVVHQLLAAQLIDEIILSVVPVLLGAGTRLFKEGRPQQLLELLSSKSFESGLVQLHYRVK
ncbi:MAG: dihydrofolate reductase family protein [Sphingobacteriaceae bacterium]|nr:dihydrofolate reductase family protein [Sphingobacteriaceae bacterium]